MSDAPNDTTPPKDYNYFVVISDDYCDLLEIPRGTPAQSLLNAVMDEPTEDDV